MHASHLKDIASLTYGMDIIILVVSTSHEETFWKKRLELMRGQVLKEKTMLITVTEDWKGGAGNALGTLYAFSKAQQQMLSLYKLDLLHEIEKGAAVGLYHTAGLGTRLAPLTNCEYNSKSRIKLFGPLFEKTKEVPITLLEATLKQTSIFAPKRKGRLNVFWGDQLFIPEKEIEETSRDVDLLVKLIPSPSKEEWQKQGYSKYGLVLQSSDKTFKQLEKLSYDEFEKLKLEEGEKIGLSLGSFSLSLKILSALLKEFEKELTEKKGKLDTDPHLWMPLSLDPETYISILSKKTSKEFAKAHYARMQTFKKKFEGQDLLGSTDLGYHSYWWDFGNMGAYYKNSLTLLGNNEEAIAMRTFFNSENRSQTDNSKLKVDNSILINCQIRSGHIKNSVLMNVTAHHVEIEGSLLMDTSAQTVDAKEALLYNCVENGPLSIQGNVRADLFSQDNGHVKLHNSIFTPVGWHECAKENSFSFASVHKLVQRLHPSEGQQQAQAAHARVKQAVINFQNLEKE